MPPWPAPEQIGVLSLLTCELVIQDDLAGRFSAINVFTKIRAESFPHQVYPMALYVEFNRGKSWNAVMFRIVDAAYARPPVLECMRAMEHGDALNVRTSYVVLPPLSFPEPGDYMVQVLHQLVEDGEFALVKERRITLELEPPFDFDALGPPNA